MDQITFDYAYSVMMLKDLSANPPEYPLRSAGASNRTHGPHIKARAVEDIQSHGLIRSSSPPAQGQRSSSVLTEHIVLPEHISLPSRLEAHLAA